MTLPRKGSHHVEVDGKPYRWMQTSGSLWQGFICLTIQGEGRPVHVTLRGNVLYDWPHRLSASLVGGIIEEAVRMGWDPVGRVCDTHCDITLD